MRKIALLLLVFCLLHGCSETSSQPLDPNNPAAYVENKELIQYLDKEGFDINIPATEAGKRYGFDKQDNSNSHYDYALVNSAKVMRGGGFNGRVSLYSEMGAGYNHLINGIGFTNCDISSNQLKRLVKCIAIENGVSNPRDLNTIMSDFVNKYGSNGLVLEYNKEDKLYHYSFPPIYHIKYKNRCVKFTFTALLDGGRTYLLAMLVDDDLIERLDKEKKDASRNVDEVNKLKGKF